MRGIWIFVADGASMPSAAFDDEELARVWIKKHALSGTLTEYPINTSVYDRAIERSHFEITTPAHRSPRFVGRFTSAYLKQIHFEAGEDF